MLQFYFTNDEFIYLYSAFNDKKYKNKNKLFMSLGIVLLLLSILSYVAMIKINPGFKTIFNILLSSAALILVISFYENRKFIFSNGKSSFEYAITNKRILLYDLIKNEFYQYSIYEFRKIIARTGNNNKGKGDLVLVNIFNPKVFSFSIDNEYLTIDSDRITFNKLKNIYKLNHQLQYTLYVYDHNITNISDMSNYLLPNERIIYETSFYGSFKIKNYKMINFLVIYLLFFIIFYAFQFLFYDLFIFELLAIFFPFVFLLGLYWGKTIYSFIKYKDRSYNFKYAVTNQRVIFLDLSNYILYSGNINSLKYIRVAHYDKKENVGDIILSINDTSPSNILRGRSAFRRMNDYETMFPEHYENNLFIFDYNPINCPKIRFYRVKDPRSIIDNYIAK